MQRGRAVQQSVFVSVLLPPHAMLEGMHPCKVRSQVVLFAFFFFFPRLLSVSIPSRACLVFSGRFVWQHGEEWMDWGHE